MDLRMKSQDEVFISSSMISVVDFGVIVFFIPVIANFTSGMLPSSNQCLIRNSSSFIAKNSVYHRGLTVFESVHQAHGESRANHAGVCVMP